VFTLAEESSPGSFRALYHRASALAEGGLVDEAVKEFERLARDTSRTTLYAYPLANLYRRQGRFDDAWPSCGRSRRSSRGTPGPSR